MSGLAAWGIWCVGAHVARIPLALWVAPAVSMRTEMTIPQMLKKVYGKKVSFFMAIYMLITLLSISDNYDAGVQCAKDMMQRFDHARIALLEHSKALSAVDRINGFKDTVALNENYQIVGSEDCLGQTELALPALNKIIQQGIDFDVVFCLNDPTALGALASIEENDLGHDVFIYGVDGSPNIKKLLAETKEIVGTSSQSPTSLGKETIKVAYKMLHHKKYKRSIIVPTKLITKENIEEYDITGWQ